MNVVKLIGMRRIINLCILFGATTALVGSWYLGVMPMREAEQTKLATLTGDISTLSTKIQNVKQDVVDFKKNYPEFQKLSERGFNLVQDRFFIGRQLDELRAKSGILGFSYSIDALQTLNDADADLAELSLVDSKITFNNIESVVDTGIINLMELALRNFPMHVRVSALNIDRPAEVKKEDLQALSSGQGAGFAKGSITMDWITLVPKAAKDEKAGKP